MVFYSLHLKKAPCSLVILHFSDHVQSRLGWFIVPKVLKHLVSVHFSIHVDPRTSPSEKMSIFFKSTIQGKWVEVLVHYIWLKYPWKSWTSHIIFYGGPTETFWTFQKKFGSLGTPPPMGPRTLQMPHWVPDPLGGGAPRPSNFLRSPGSPNK